MPIDRITPVIEILKEFGYEPAGFRSVPGGTIARIQGNRFVASSQSTRIRLAKDDLRVTVGKITTCFYRVDNTQPVCCCSTDYKNFRTKEVDKIREYLKKEAK